MTLRQENKNIYWAWKSMKQRCLNPKCRAYRNYGARGIGVCDEWMEFEPFCEWALNNGWEKGRDLDRVDNDGDYEPSNCRWTTRRENVNNRRNTTMLTVDGVTRPGTEWARMLGIPTGTVKAWAITHSKGYAEAMIADVMENGYKPRDYGRGSECKWTPVVCTSTGRKFPSLKAAAEEYGISPSTLSCAIKSGWKTHGLKFEKLECH